MRRSTPPELLVWSIEVDEDGQYPYRTHARVVATGAWLGATLAFVVFPPPRPSVNSVLHHSVRVDKQVGATFDVLPYPEDNPNHLVCRISRRTDVPYVPLALYDSGLVGMTDQRAFHAVVDCWWDEQTSTLNGKVEVAFSGQPAVGTHILYYDPDDFDPNNLEFPIWQRLETDNQGHFSLAGLKPKSYVFRPAGSGWDFYSVPRKLSLNAGANSVTFDALKENYIELPPAVKEPIQLLPITVVDPNANLEKGQLQAAAWQVLVERLITWDTNIQVGEAGVKNNTMGINWYAQEVEFDFNLASFVNGQGKPILDLESAIKPPQTSPSGAEWYLNVPTLNGIANFIIGSVGPGVAGAKLRVRLVLGNDAVGKHSVEEIEVVTDKLGNARFVVEDGSHPEDVSLYVLVEENPVNPWFKPVSWSPPRFFYPGNKTDDSSSGRAVYHFRLDALPLEATSSLSRRVAEQLQAAAVQRQSLVNRRAPKKTSRKPSQAPPPGMDLPILPIKPRP